MVVLLLCSFCESNLFFLDLVFKWLNLTESLDICLRTSVVEEYLLLQ